jgi:uncharacterized protein
MNIYLDTSVLIPTLVREAASDAVKAYLTTRQERLISDFAAVEVASALSRLIRTGRLAADEAAACLADFDTWRAATSSTVDLHAADARLSLAYVRRFELMLRAPDALHLAITNRLQATLLTLDKRMEQAARQLGIAVDVPRTN